MSALEQAAGPRLEVRELVRTYRQRAGLLGGDPVEVRAVDGVDLSIAPGETLGLVGESGCGKSTLARMIAGLERPDAGSLLFEGAVLPAGRGLPPEMRRAVQMIFQDPYSSLDPRMSVGRTIGEGLAMLGNLDRAARRERVLALMDMVGLAPEHYGRYPHQFSGGQRQRVAIARALAPEPRLVVCDEPVSALDVSIQAQVLNLLQDLRERLGLSYLFISHDLAVVGHLSDRVAVMYLGRIVEEGPAAEFFAGPLHPYSRLLMAAAPRPDPDQPRSRAASAGDAPVLTQRPSGCPFHPRCAEALPVCRESAPRMRRPAPGRRTACHLYPE